MQTKEWTLMFYFASDNPLASTIVSQLKALKDAGYHPDANVIAQFDPHVVNTPVHVFDVNAVNKFWNPGQAEVGFAPNDPFVRDLVLDRLWGEDKDTEDMRRRVLAHVTANPDRNKGTEFNPPKPSAAMSGEQNTKDSLTDFLNFCRMYYPARHYLLFILGHGQVVGNDSLLYDDHAANKSLVLTELGEVLRAFNSDVQNDTVPGQVEMIGLHSCSMSALEVAYELKGAAKYLLASQGPAYVGSWPYKQILIRIFKELNAPLSTADVNGSHDGVNGGKVNGKQSFVEKLRKAQDPVARFVRDSLKRETRIELRKYKSNSRPESTLVSRIVADLNELLVKKDIAKQPDFLKMPSLNGTGELKATVDLEELNKDGLRRYNRLLLADAFPEIAGHPKINVESMLSKIFFYCIYNSYDFQLAGYPYDMCLTNLHKVSETEEPINNLADSLIKVLKSGNRVAKQLILLSHWNAQSFYGEEYVDLYDFCFSLKQRYKETKRYLRNVPTIKPVLDACDGIIEVLEKGREKLITHQAFSGAAFQYSHGLSIYFPWAEAVSSPMWKTHYGEYRLNKKTRWKEFLSVYFKETMRKPRAVELEAAGIKPEPDAPMSARLLELMGQIGARVFDVEGQLQKPGPDSPMGKWGPDDPTGGRSDCPTIKNYPLYTGKLALSDDFLVGKIITAD